jgi:hypothetical protein
MEAENAFPLELYWWVHPVVRHHTYIADIAASILQRRDGWLVEEVHSFDPANPLVEWMNIALTLQFTNANGYPSEQAIKTVPELKGLKYYRPPDVKPSDNDDDERPPPGWTLLLREKALLAMMIPGIVWLFYYIVLAWLFSLGSLRRLARGG